MLDTSPSGISLVKSLVSSRNGVCPLSDSFVAGMPARPTYASTHWSTSDTLSYSRQRTECLVDVPIFSLQPATGRPPPGTHTLGASSDAVPAP